MPQLVIDIERQAWFTPGSLATYLQVSDRMIRKWVAEGRLRSYKLDGCRALTPPMSIPSSSSFKTAAGRLRHEPSTPYRR